MRDAKKRTRTTRPRRTNVSKPLSLNGKTPIRGLLGPVTGDPQPPRGCSVAVAADGSWPRMLARFF